MRASAHRRLPSRSGGVIRPAGSAGLVRRQILAMLGAVLALAAMASPATALAGSPAGTCAGGIITSNTYSSFTVTGNCMFAPGAVVRINGNLTVADGAMLNDHAASAAEVHITGNVRVGRGAVLGLGTYATPGRVGPDTVGGSIVAIQPRTLYLGSMTVGGSVISIGGGLASTSAADFRNFPIKDNVIRGNLVILGWRGGWIGVIRNHVGGSVIFMANVSRSSDAGPGLDLDSSEVQTNVIAHNLVCFGNAPAAHVNPGDGGQPNAVGGRAIGQCAGLAG